MSDKTIYEESKHLNATLDKLGSAKKKIEESLKVMGKENLTKLKELREDPQAEPHDLLLLLEAIHQKNAAFNLKDKYKRLEEFDHLIKEPYFSRIDLKSSGTNETDRIYIGKFGFTDKEPVITDWRAKIASIYYRYRYPQKNVVYTTPDGPVTGDLLLKRTFEIENGTLIKYYNNDIQLDESEILIEKVEKRTGGVLEDIVETIQEGQLDIIEADPRQICIVQGCFGRGRSTVAIHKLSHIFFNHSNIIQPERSVVVAKNQIQAGYLSTLFPKLGIFDVSYKSLRELVYNIIYREELKIKVDLDIKEPPETFTLEQINKTRELIKKVHVEYEGKINGIFSGEEGETFAGFAYQDKETVDGNLKEVIDDMSDELELQTGYLKESPRSIRAYRYKLNIKVLKKIVNKLRRLRIRLRESALSDIVKELGIDTTKPLGYNRFLIYLLAYSGLIGFSKSQLYQYCVIDEGQDFSLLEYLILSKLVVKGRLCILGDLNQSYNHNGIVTWEDIMQVIEDAKQANVFELTTNYRSTKPIIDYANSILQPFTDTYLPKSINRAGPEPEVLSYTRINDVLDGLTEQLSKDTINLNKTVGIICSNEELINKSADIIRRLGVPEDKIIHLDTKKRISFISRGFYISNFHECKGLEFSKVYVLGRDPHQAANFNEAKKYFVAVTRAMNELVILTLTSD
jgi:DNA helicase II / ATP-dependent DNA helicase PcrA